MTIRILHGDCIEMMRTLPDKSVHCVVTSPPYWGLRDYGVDGQIGLEASPMQWVQKMVEVFREVRRVLRDDGTVWVNIGDSYSNEGKWGGSTGGKHVKSLHGNTSIGRRKNNIGIKSKNLMGMPWRLAFALQDDGWYLRQEIIWSKPNPMPESVKDRCTKSHEQIFLLSKSSRYYFDVDAIAEAVSPNTHARMAQDVEKQIGSARANAGGKTNGNLKAVVKGSTKAFANAPGSKQNTSFAESVCLRIEKRNKRSVWEVATQPFSEAHFATFPPQLIEPCIKAGTSEKGCCNKCGAPIKRIMEREIWDRDEVETKTSYPKGSTAERLAKLRQKARAQGEEYMSVVSTLNWDASCECGDDTIPKKRCIVLDPFFGAGTTGLVADRLQRDCIGIELSQEYINITERRLRKDAGLLINIVRE